MVAAARLKQCFFPHMKSETQIFLFLYKDEAVQKDGARVQRAVVMAGRSALLIGSTHNLISTWLHIDTYVSSAMRGSSWTVTYPPSFPPIMLPPPPSTPTSPPIPLLFRFISLKNNESKHLQPWLHRCSNTQPADSKTHSGIKVKKGGGGDQGVWGFFFFPMKLWAQRSLGCRAHLLRLWGK